MSTGKSVKFSLTSRLLTVSPILAAALVLIGTDQGFAGQTVTLLGMSDRTQIGASHHSSSMVHPRNLHIGANNAIVARKQYYAHKYQLEQIAKQMRKLQWEYRNGGGFIPSGVAAYRQRVKQRYEQLKGMWKHEAHAIKTAAREVQRQESLAAVHRSNMIARQQAVAAAQRAMQIQRQQAIAAAQRSAMLARQHSAAAAQRAIHQRQQALAAARRAGTGVHGWHRPRSHHP